MNETNEGIGNIGQVESTNGLHPTMAELSRKFRDVAKAAFKPTFEPLSPTKDEASDDKLADDDHDDLNNGNEPYEEGLTIELKENKCKRDDDWIYQAIRRDEFERMLHNAVSRHGGYLYAHELGVGGACLIYLYGPDAREMYKAIKPLLRSSQFAVGGCADVNGTEVRWD